MANRTLQAIAVIGDGDTGSIGLGQFKHIVRRNVRMVYIIENNGVYGLTKGQFSATADMDQKLKYAGTNEFLPLDLCMEATRRRLRLCGPLLRGRCQAGARPAQGGAELRGHGRARHHQPLRHLQQPPGKHQVATPTARSTSSRIHDIHFVPSFEEITVEYEPGSTTEVQMHDGSTILLAKAG